MLIAASKTQVAAGAVVPSGRVFAARGVGPICGAISVGTTG